jgi:hypothetical protein
MDGARITRVDFDRLYYPIITDGGHSDSPVFHGAMVETCSTPTPPSPRNGV